MPNTDGSAAAAAGSPPRAAPPPFRGFASPNYTPVPDELFDELLVELSGGELKALLYIIRRTFGFKRDSDTISISQMLFGIQTRDGRVLDRGIGLSKKTLLAALRALEERGIILTERRQSAEKGNEPTVYRLNVLNADGTPSTPPPTPAPASPSPAAAPGTPVEKNAPPLGGKSTPPLGEKFPQGLGGKTTPSPWGKNSPTQETVKQNPVKQHTGSQKTAGSTSFDLLATMRQEREPSGFSKNARSDAFSRRAGFSSSSPVSAGASDSGSALSERPGGSMRAEKPCGGSSEQPTLFEPQNRPLGNPPADDAAASRRGTRRPPPPKLPTYLAGLVTRYSEELHDEEHIPQNLGQAGRLWDASNCSESTFAEALSKAKAITLQRDIKKRAAHGWEMGARNKMPYYFKVLRDVLGLTEAPQTGST